MTHNQARRLADDIADMIRDRPLAREFGFAIRILNPEGGADTYGLVLTIGPVLHAIASREVWEEISTSV